jgi:spore germination protein GerM
MKNLLLILTIALCSASVLGSSGPHFPSSTTEVKVYLVAVGDDGYSGKKIGCGDSLVEVKRTIAPSDAPLKAALDELLSITEPIQKRVDLELTNYWKGTDLKVQSAKISKGTATIRITGQLPVAGVCDEPRITEQINATAKQFPSVKRVKVFLNGTPLAQAIK